MSHRSYFQKVQDILKAADITMDGSRPWDIHVHNPDFYRRILAEGSLGLGESYMDGWWDVPDLDQFFFQLFQLDLNKVKKVGLPDVLLVLRSKFFNLQSKKRSYQVAKEHYDISNKFYEKMLDKRMLYTCAYWKNAQNLDEAQEHKLELVCKKIMLKSTDKVLDLGCGFGGFAKYAAEKYGCHITSVNISQEQLRYAKESCKGLPVHFLQSDYRDVAGTFDKVVAIGLCEHVGYKNYRMLMKTVDRCLKDRGLFLLHTIGSNISLTASYDPWFDKYIFPKGMLPSVQQLAAAAERIFVMEDWHNFGADYDKTLMAWYENFDTHWKEFSGKIRSGHSGEAIFDERFYRMWKYYLLSLAGAFRARACQLWQVVFSKKGVLGGYESVR